ncbi:hypothetical protein QR680_009146 [Steinernema hermaphroditum]|uniref:HAT C-terminal dimerisation domain-containing protein n=1 Tax=Steinernema hermaphroditum TaxID=289476 RepID=A0AA39M9C9_9BILA|nr:hypothetical protein QR680_009146 [Steinernema hermaphroditum]
MGIYDLLSLVSQVALGVRVLTYTEFSFWVEKIVMNLSNATFNGTVIMMWTLALNRFIVLVLSQILRVLMSTDAAKGTAKCRTYAFYFVCISSHRNDAKNKCHLVVRDAASTMKKTTRMCGLASIDCFAHKLQLAVYGGLRSVIDDEDQFTTFIENTKKFVRKLRKSPVDRDHFKDLQSLEELSPRWLVKGIEVRWSSLHDMLERFVENRSVVKAFLIDRSDYPKFNSGDFSMMMKILHALKPIKEATTMLQGRSVTISAVIPTIVVLRRAVLNDAASELCSAILQNLETRVAGIESDANFVVATLFHVRFKRDFMEVEKKDEAAACLMDAAFEVLNDANARIKTSTKPPVAATDDNSSQISFFEKYRSVQISEDPISSPPLDDKLRLRLEVDKYLGESAQPLADPIQYWANTVYAEQFPALSQMAKKYLSAPATSVESERLFSTASLALTNLRRSMSPENLQKLLFLKSNVPLEGFAEETT